MPAERGNYNFSAGRVTPVVALGAENGQLR